jgi:hypothetical protein
MRKLFLVLGIAVAAAIGFSMSTLKAKVRRATDEFVAAVSGEHAGEVTIGSVGIALFPWPSVRIEDVRVVAVPAEAEGDEEANTEAKAEAPLIVAPDVRVDAHLLPLLVGLARVDSVRIIDPVVTLERQRDGSVAAALPLATLGRSGASEFTISVEDGRLRVMRDDAPDAEPLLDVTGISMQLGAASQGKGVVYHIARARPLGDDSSLTGDIVHVPGAGPTGGDRLDIALRLEGGDPNRLVTLPERLSRERLIGPLSVVAKASGYVGERSTEAVPAEPLDGKIEGTLGLEVFGLERPLKFDLETALDDKRFMLRKGSADWGGLPLDVSGWVARGPESKIGGKLRWEHVDAAALLSKFDVAERWRPQAKVSGEVRVMGQLDRPLVRYEATAPTVKLVPWPSLPLVSGPMRVTGSLLAINADVSGSFDGTDLRIADARLPEALFGVQYWRDKLTLSALDQEAWGGRADLSFAYRPDETNDVEGGGILSHMNAEEVLSNLFPKMDFKIHGSLDSIFQIGIAADGPWAKGRVGIHHGKVGQSGLVRSVLEEAFTTAGRHFEVEDSLMRSYPGALAEGRTEFQRIAFDFQTRTDGVDLKTAEIRLPYATVNGEGRLDTQGTIVGSGTISLSEPLTADLARRTKALRALIADDGRIHIPIHFEGKPDAAEVHPDPRFVEVLERALRGEKVEPFPAPVEGPGLGLDMPSLREHFQR